MPIDYVYDDEENIIFEIDVQVPYELRFMFDSFRLTDSAYGVVHKFLKESLELPKRSYVGVWKGKLVWGPPDSKSRPQFAKKSNIRWCLCSWSISER